MTAENICPHTGSISQNHDVIGGVEESVSAINIAMNEGFRSGHGHAVAAGFAILRVPPVHVAVSCLIPGRCVFDHAVDNADAAAGGRARLGVAAVYVFLHSTVRECHRAAGQAIRCPACVDSAQGRNLRKENLVACGVTPAIDVNPAGVQISVKRRPVREGNRVV